MKNFKEKTERWRAWRWAVLLLAILVTVGTAVRYVFFREEREQVQILYLLRVEGISRDLLPEDVSGLIPVGAEVRNEKGSLLFGTVAAVERLPSYGVLKKEGEVYRAEHPQKCDLLVWVRADARRPSGEGYRVASVRIAAGAVGSFRIGGLLAAGARILEVKEVVAE